LAPRSAPTPQYAIHIIRFGADGRTPDLLLTRKERSALDAIRARARDLLHNFPQLRPTDFVIVRVVKDGRSLPLARG
jgi:hypothetical protein